MIQELIKIINLLEEEISSIEENLKGKKRALVSIKSLITKWEEEEEDDNSEEIFNDNMSRRSKTILLQNGIDSYEWLIKFLNFTNGVSAFDKLMTLKNCGRKTAGQILEALKDSGFNIEVKNAE